MCGKYGRIGVLQSSARLQKFVNRQKFTKNKRESAIFLANPRIFSLFLAMFGQFDGKIITKRCKMQVNFVILHKICTISAVFKRILYDF